MPKIEKVRIDASHEQCKYRLYIVLGIIVGEFKFNILRTLRWEFGVDLSFHLLPILSSLKITRKWKLEQVVYFTKGFKGITGTTWVFRKFFYESIE